MEQEHFDGAAAALARPAQTRGDDARSIEDEHVVGPEQRRKIGKSPVVDAVRAKHHQTAGVARFDRGLRDQFGR
jgi:hypothetical protein